MRSITIYLLTFLSVSILLIKPVYCQTLFTERGLAIGINHSYTFGQSAGGVSFIDFNGDGWDDLTLGTANGELIHFYKNTGNGFVRNPPLNGNNTEHKQLFWVDFDNDGDKDLFICSKGAVNRLYQNKGNLILEDITEISGLPLHELNTFNACWADFNRDGWLDLYVCERVSGDRVSNRNYLFENNADGTFTDISEESNVLAAERLPFSSSALDFNNDNWPDIYVANDRLWGNVMLQNNTDGSFTEVSQETNTDFFMDGMSVALGDYNNDSRTDIYVTNTEAGNLLLENQNIEDQSVFINRADELGVSFNGTAWGANFIDANNDGHLDIYTSGSDLGSVANSSAFYLREGEVFTEIKAGFEKDTVISYANAIGDYNNDGFNDMIAVNFGQVKSFFFENNALSENNYIKIKLEGVLSNKDAIGCKIELFADTLYQSYYTHSGIGFLAQNSENYTFGLGKLESIDSIKVRWPTGHVDRLFDLEVNQQIYILEGSTTNGEILLDEGIEIKDGNFPSSTIETVQENTIKVFPNPIQNRTFIQSEFPLERIQLFNAQGNLLFEKPCKNSITQQLELNGFDRGIYFLKIKTESGSDIQKIVKLN